MPFIDLNALNPLRKDDNTAGDQGQTAQATDPNTQADPNAQTVADSADQQTQLPMQDEAAQDQPVSQPVAEVATPEVTPEPVVVDTDMPLVNEGATDDQVLNLQASSSSEEQELDKAGNPIPEIEVSPGGEVQMDESGMREVRGPEFEGSSAPTTPPVTTPTSVEPADTPEPVSLEPVELEPVATTQTPETTQEDDTASQPDVQPVVEPVLDTPPAQTTPPAQITDIAEPQAGALPELQSNVKSYSLEELIAQAIQMNASDLHLTAGYRAIVRVNGVLQQLQSEVLDDAKVKDLIKGVVGGVKLENPDDIRDLDLAYEYTDGTRFRVNVFKQQETQSAVFRVIPSKISSLEELGMPEKLHEFTQMSQGLVLVTGPTGSGKSTTLAAMVNEINMKEPRHIITIEDPIEFVYPKGVALVDQRGIRQDTDGWEDALRSVLRQDPNVVLIGEMRDLETISSALHIAETGHLVFATLHTNSAAQSIDRIIDVFSKEQQAQIRTQLASVLKAVVSQRLVPGKSGGRKVAAEIMISTPAVANSIRTSKVYQIDNIIQTSGDLGMISMEKSLAGLVQKGFITIEDAQFYANRPDEVASMLGAKQ